MTQQLNAIKDKLEVHLRSTGTAYQTITIHNPFFEVGQQELLETQYAMILTRTTNVTKSDFVVQEIEISELELIFNHQHPAYSLIEDDDIDEDADQDTIDSYWEMGEALAQQMAEDTLSEELGLDCESVSETESRAFGAYSVRAVLKRPIVVGFSKIEDDEVEVSIR